MPTQTNTDPAQGHHAGPLTYLVVDLETTGLDDSRDHIIEVAAVGLPHDLSTDLFVLNEVVAPDLTTRELISQAPADVLAMHKANGLLDDLDKPNLPALSTIEENLLHLIDQHSADGTEVYLAGSGVAHFDIRFIRSLMPRLTARLHYSIADVGIMRRFYRQQTGAHLCDANTKKTHRALDDVRCHIDELRAFRALMIGTQPGATPTASQATHAATLWNELRGVVNDDLRGVAAEMAGAVMALAEEQHTANLMSVLDGKHRISEFVTGTQRDAMVAQILTRLGLDPEEP